MVENSKLDGQNDKLAKSFFLTILFFTIALGAIVGILWIFFLGEPHSIPKTALGKIIFGVLFGWFVLGWGIASFIYLAIRAILPTCPSQEFYKQKYREWCQVQKKIIKLSISILYILLLPVSLALAVGWILGFLATGIIFVHFFILTSTILHFKRSILGAFIGFILGFIIDPSQIDAAQKLVNLGINPHIAIVIAGTILFGVAKPNNPRIVNFYKKLLQIIIKE